MSGSNWTGSFLRPGLRRRPIFMNVRGGGWFLEDPYVEQAERFEKWISQIRGRVLLLEIGAGFNTPGVIRWPMERITYAHPGAFLVRVNLKWPEVPDEISGRSLSLRCSAMDAVTAIWKAACGHSA